jgi:hypothetical protein
LAQADAPHLPETRPRQHAVATRVFARVRHVEGLTPDVAARYDRRAMNRLKLWVFMALCLGAGVGNAVFVSRWLTHRSVAQIDRELRGAATQLDARSQILAGEAGQLADAVARSPSVVQALAGEGDVATASQSAAAAAQAPAGTSPSGRALLVGAWGPDAHAIRVGGAAVEVDNQAEALLSVAARDAVRREGHVIAGDALYYVVAVPAGQNASVAVGVPITPAWLAMVRASTGADVTLHVPGRPPRSTLAQGDAALVAEAAKEPSPRPVDVGTLGALPLTLGPELPSPPMPLLLVAGTPAHRVQAVALKGLKGAAFAVSQPVGPVLAPVVTYQWVSLVVLAFLLVVGIVAGLFVTDEQRAMLPKDLIAAADRIGRGDFTARATNMAGSLGTVAVALNRAAEAAQAARASPAASAPEPEPEPAQPLAAAEPAPATAAVRDAFEAASSAPQDHAIASATPAEPEPAAGMRPLAAYAFAPPASVAPEAQAALEPPPPPVPAAAAFHSPEPTPTGIAALNDPASNATRFDPRAEDLLKHAAGAVEPSAPPPAPDGRGADEDHWQAVYREFLDVREQCGEPRHGIPYERFRQKLEKNRDQLVAKYGCRTVRFQVYVKDGKAALKASPVR